MKKADRITAIILMGITAFLLFQTQNIRVVTHTVQSSRDFPRLVLGVVFCLSLFLFLQTLLPKSGPEDKVGWATLLSRNRLVLLGLLTAYFLLMPVIGFLAASGGFIVVTVISLSPNRKKDLPVSLVVAGGMVSLVYAVFAHWLQVILP